MLALATAELKQTPQKGPALVCDWGAATGSFGRMLSAASADAVTIRSFDLIPAGEGVEFGDQSSPPASLACGSVRLITGIANLTSTHDVAGFFAGCASRLQPGGSLLLLQPIGFASPAMSMAGFGRISGLFVTEARHIALLDALDKGLGKTMVLVLRMRRTEVAMPAECATPAAYYEPVLTQDTARWLGPGQVVDAGVYARASAVVRSLKVPFHQKLLGAFLMTFCCPAPSCQNARKF